MENIWHIEELTINTTQVTFLSYTSAGENEQLYYTGKQEMIPYVEKTPEKQTVNMLNVKLLLPFCNNRNWYLLNWHLIHINKLHRMNYIVLPVALKTFLRLSSELGATVTCWIFFFLHIFFLFARLVFALLVISNTPLISLRLSLFDFLSFTWGQNRTFEGAKCRRTKIYLYRCHVFCAISCLCLFSRPLHFFPSCFH